MDFFKIVKDKVSKAGNFAVQKSNEVVEITRLKFSISELEEKLADTYKTIGMLTCRALTDEEDTTQEVTELCANVKDLDQELEGLKEKLYEAKKLVKCPQCSNPASEDAVYCQHCGTKL